MVLTQCCLSRCVALFTLTKVKVRNMYFVFIACKLWVGLDSISKVVILTSRRQLGGQPSERLGTDQVIWWTQDTSPIRRILHCRIGRLVRQHTQSRFETVIATFDGSRFWITEKLVSHGRFERLSPPCDLATLVPILDHSWWDYRWLLQLWLLDTTRGKIKNKLWIKSTPRVPKSRESQFDGFQVSGHPKFIHKNRCKPQHSTPVFPRAGMVWGTTPPLLDSPNVCGACNRSRSNDAQHGYRLFGPAGVTLEYSKCMWEIKIARLQRYNTSFPRKAYTQIYLIQSHKWRIRSPASPLRYPAKWWAPVLWGLG